MTELTTAGPLEYRVTVHFKSVYIRIYLTVALCYPEHSGSTLLVPLVSFPSRFPSRSYTDPVASTKPLVRSASSTEHSIGRSR